MVATGKKHCLRAGLPLAVGVVLAVVAPAGASGATIWDADGPWGPYGWDAEAGRFHQPHLAAPIPDPMPLGSLDDADFDADGVRNRDDNCLLVANPGQEPAQAAADGEPVGPADMAALSAAWKAAHPDARFLGDAELGQACSGYNSNYLRTVSALVNSGNRRKLEIFRYLGESGPMYGGAENPFPNGKPTDYDRFGTVSSPPDLEPSPTAAEDLPRDADGEIARGNMTPSMPICSGYDQYVAFGRWLLGLDRVGGPLGALLDDLRGMGRTAYERFEAQIGCNSKLQRPAWEAAMHHFWAGKRLYTNADGGRITNRFVASVTEHPLYSAFLHAEPFRTLAKATGMHPYADQAETSGQSRHGIIFRGRSYIDGREAILMDWRGFEAAWPLGPGTHISGLFGMLIYDECRAIQTGVYNCTAVTDWAVGERRHTFQEGYMPWVVKGPPSIEEYITAVRPR